MNKLIPCLLNKNSFDKDIKNLFFLDKNIKKKRVKVSYFSGGIVSLSRAIKVARLPGGCLPLLSI